MDSNWQLKSRLLTVRQFNPSVDVLRSERMSEILRVYLSDVLEEFRIPHNSIFSSTTDAGSHVRRLAEKIMPSSWEWCIAHMLNCALVEAS